MISRYENSGIEGLKEKRKYPLNHRSRTKETVEKNILELKGKYALWGAKKIRRLLFNLCDEKDIPSVVTVHNILKRNGLVKPQKRCKRVKPLFPVFDTQECN
jgi:hypothetical protein